MDADTKKEMARLRNLNGTKDLSDNDIEDKASVNLKVREFKSEKIFSDPVEQKLAENKFKNYLEVNRLESTGDIDTLKSLVYLEVFERRIQSELNKLAEKQQNPPEKLTKQLIDAQNQKLSLKLKLGIDKKEEEKDELTGLEILKKRLATYINENKEEFTITSPSGEMMLLRRRVKDFEIMKHPWFAGRWLFNYEILRDVKDKKLSKEDAHRYLNCASQGKEYKGSLSKEYCVDYINYCLNHWSEISEHFEE
jgi:hypothetical protein